MDVKEKRIFREQLYNVIWEISVKGVYRMIKKSGLNGHIKKRIGLIRALQEKMRCLVLESMKNMKNIKTQGGWFFIENTNMRCNFSGTL